MKINKNRWNGKKKKTTTKRVVLLFALVKFFLFYLYFFFLLGKGGFGLDQGLVEVRRTPPGLPAGGEGLSSASSRKNFPELLCGVGHRRGAHRALGFRILLSSAPHCPHFKEMPPSTRISPVHHPHALGAAPPPLPRALSGALNNDICMQGAIHKYVRAGEI